MRLITVLTAILLLSAMCFGQSWGIPGRCLYGCEPYVPLITTPMLSLEVTSPNAAGATNATGGLIAGASNSTLSMVSGNLDASYTVPVWYAGGGPPLISPAVNIGAELTRLARAERRSSQRSDTERKGWLYFSSAEQTASPVLAASVAKAPHPAVRVFTNADVQRQNQNNGLVKYDNKTEKIQ